jgi:response regulator receiver domain protein
MLLNLVDTGIDGFVSKESVQDELLIAIETILDGDEYFGSNIASILRSLMSDAKQRERARAKDLFSERELMVIELCSQGLPTKNISAELGISPRTVDAHKANIFSKLGITNTVELVRYAIKHRLVKI